MFSFVSGLTRLIFLMTVAIFSLYLFSTSIMFVLLYVDQFGMMMPLHVTEGFKGWLRLSSSSSSSSSTIFLFFFGFDISSCISDTSLFLPDFLPAPFSFEHSSIIVPKLPASLLMLLSFCFLSVHSSNSLGLYFYTGGAPPLYFMPMMYLCNVLLVIANLTNKKAVVM